MYKRMTSYIEKHNLLYPSQYGFRKGHSTQHAILDIINDIQTNMNQRLLSCGVSIDLKKAFDTVDHEILLNKLNHYGFRGIINDWFSSKIARKQLKLVNISQIKSSSPVVFPKGPFLVHCFSCYM